jgi:hypothetical protein
MESDGFPSQVQGMPLPNENGDADSTVRLNPLAFPTLPLNTLTPSSKQPALFL